VTVTGYPPTSQPGAPGATSTGVIDPWHVVGAAGEPAFQNGWGNQAGYDAVAFRKDPFGRVWIRGAVSGGATGTTIFTLPAGYRPVAADYHVTLGDSGAAGNYIYISTAGLVQGTRAGGTLYLPTITFDTDTVSSYMTGPQGPAGPVGSAVPIEGWHIVGGAGEPAFQNSWVNYAGGTPCRFRIDPFGKVTIQGLLAKGGGNWIANEVLFTLPAAYRPADSMGFTAPALGTVENVGRVNVNSDGTVALAAGGNANPVTWFNLNMIEFWAAAPPVSVPAGPVVSGAVAYQEFNAPVTVSGVFATPTTVVTAPAFTADGVQAYWIEFSVPQVNPGVADFVAFLLYDGATNLGQFATEGASAATDYGGVLGRVKLTPSAGAHTYSIRAFRGTANGTVNAGPGGSGAWTPGSIRIVADNVTTGPAGPAGPGGLTPVAKSASYQAQNGECVMMSGAFTVALPMPIAGRLVSVISVNGTGAAPCLVSTPSGVIKGKGVAAAATSIKLGAQAASVTLLADGTNWNIIDGEQDTGWLTASPLTSGATGSFQYRKMGNRVVCYGNWSAGTMPNGGVFWNMPVGFRPPAQYDGLMFGSYNSAPIPAFGIILANGDCYLYYGAAATPSQVGMANVHYVVD
jgi:hypothetical protein